MSFKEYRPARQGIFRSRSFGGFINQRSMSSPTSPLGTPVLGQNVRPGPTTSSRKLSSNLGTSFSRKCTPKLPKVPRPNRTLLMFHSVKKGIAECIKATEDDIDSLRVSEDISASSSTGQGRIMELEKQVKAAERYQKKLEFHLSKLEELEDNYKLQLQLREGVRTMAKAYVSSDGLSKRESLTQVKSGYKECTQNLCAIEAQLENMMGTFHCSMKGLVGFARLIPGDVFEVSIKHGQQKWRTKGRVGNNTQTWEQDTHVFKALVREVLCIKAMENKSLKSVVLGQKNCETRDLFSSHPQMMTVSINTNGSIKLSVLVNWNPLEGIDETFHPYEPVPRLANTPRRRLVQSMYINGSDSYSDLSSDNSSTGGGSVSHRFSVPTFPSATYASLAALTTSPYQPTTSSSCSTSASMYNVSSTAPSYHPSAAAGLNHHPPPLGGATRPNSIAIMGTIAESETLMTHYSSSSSSTEQQHQQQHRHNNRHSLDASDLAVRPKHFDMRLLRNSISLDDDVMSHMSHDAPPQCLEDALEALRTTLEDYQGQFPELQGLEEAVLALDKMIRPSPVSSSPQGSTKEISQSIENALGAFDFLEAEYCQDGYGSGTSSRRSSLDHLESKCTLSPESTAKTADSGIECIASRLSEDVPLESSEDISPEPLSTQNDEVDMALIWHLTYCNQLFEHIGNFGPLKCREIRSLEKLKQQAAILDSLYKMAKEGAAVKDLQQVLSKLTSSKELRQFWVKCVDHSVLYINAEKFLAHLERNFGDTVREKYDVPASTVFRYLVSRILDVPMFNPELCKPCPNVTLHQLFSYASHTNPLTLVTDMAAQLWVVNRLRSGSTDIVIKTVLTYRDRVPAPECLKAMVLLLTCENVEVKSAVSTYIKSIGLAESRRQQTVVLLVEVLEERSAELRAATLHALRLLQASEAQEQIVYLCQSDPSSIVRQKAKDALFSFGEEGRTAYEESQRSSHGFQGVRL